LSVRHKAGSLEAVVQKNRWRNLGITGAILLLLMAAVVALVRYTRRAQTLADLQMQFVAGVSHELRTPLTVMRTAGHNLRQSRVASDASRVERYGALIEEQATKLTDIVEQVLRFANTRAGRVIGAKEPLSIEAVIDDAIEAGRRTLDEQHCTVTKDIASDIPPIDGDRTSLQHALHNFIDNAAKYGRGGECIAISAQATNGDQPRMVEIRIRDRGRGIPKDELKYIFDPFYRGRSAVEDQVHGTGLGLDLARRIIEAHHGTVSIDSEEGKGTEVLVCLPAAQNE
jgi:signal transduction histidine kinase